MGIKKWIRKIKGEKEVIEGEATKDRTYSSENRFVNRSKAAKEYDRSVEKLFNVNLWSKLPGVSSTFQLYNIWGEEKKSGKPEVNDYIKILLPGPVPENWVIVTDIKEEENSAEFTVSPSEDPTEREKGQKEIEHFFIDEATSTFRIERKDNIIHAYEIGKNEGINNQVAEAGKRKIINTIIAEGGWAGVQKFQWEKLTDYLVHKIEIEVD
ncbi:hypothetical protein RM549_17720 [Salegentibacter sp. F188]|uniref:Uncharacterized protein n=1 Tax=Autumnicola patrickiae TaxID=3075591 RepID=A0ABU3E6P8_9FLAO|nr:hypothetical protein [Salegentibacter sp. F188]MDT0691635.1 hypothetical protein [Salegentibacter sp. F188]